MSSPEFASREAQHEFGLEQARKSLETKFAAVDPTQAQEFLVGADNGYEQYLLSEISGTLNGRTLDQVLQEFVAMREAEEGVASGTVTAPTAPRATGSLSGWRAWSGPQIHQITESGTLEKVL